MHIKGTGVSWHSTCILWAHTTYYKLRIFIIKILSNSLAYVKIKDTKYMRNRNINDNVVQGCLSENYLTQNFIAKNISDTKYL